MSSPLVAYSFSLFFLVWICEFFEPNEKRMRKQMKCKKSTNKLKRSKMMISSVHSANYIFICTNIWFFNKDQNLIAFMQPNSWCSSSIRKGKGDQEKRNILKNMNMNMTKRAQEENKHAEQNKLTTTIDDVQRKSN